MKPLPASLLAILGVLASAPAAEVRIDDLRPVQEVFSNPEGKVMVVIRRFNQDGTAHVLAVAADTLSTQVSSQDTVSRWKPEAQPAFADTPYGKLLERHSAAPFPLQNDGLIHAEAPLEGWFLTVDMCPSRRRFEREFFERIARLGSLKSPLPVTLCMTGGWMRERRDEFAWLREQAKGSLAITWVNHSWTHPYDPALPLDKNFLLQDGVKLDEEILRTEQLLLAHALTPSVFFRFPGLVSDENLVKRLGALSLIPLGADAWLNKGQAAQSGSIILVHGNGNEHAGIVKFYQFLEAAAKAGATGPTKPRFRPILDAVTAPE